jgi:uncharacterized protein GlcG (DUF336 family)
VALVCTTGIASAARNEQDNQGTNSACGSLPGYTALKNALIAATSAETSGLNNQMWGTIVDRDGVVCAVAFTGANRGAQWPGSRVISAQKANTANSFSLDSSSYSNGSGQPNGLALSTANLYSAVQPGGSLFGLQESNPVDTGVAYQGPSSQYGAAQDPMTGSKIGGVNVFGGGLALYATPSVSTICPESAECPATPRVRITSFTTSPVASAPAVMATRSAPIQRILRLCPQSSRSSTEDADPPGRELAPTRIPASAPPGGPITRTLAAPVSDALRRRSCVSEVSLSRPGDKLWL